MRYSGLIIALLAVTGGLRTASGADETGVKQLVVLPPVLELRGPRSQHGLLVTAALSNGQSRDVTRTATYTVQDPAVAKVTATGECVPQAHGQTAVTVTYGGLSVNVPVAIPV